MKIKPFYELINRFYKKEKIKFYTLIFFSLFAGLFEYMGLILIFQFVLFLSNPNSQHCTKIIYFFQNNLHIENLSQISLILGLFVALIYILKNIYMFIFTKFNHTILEDLSINMTIKTIENILLSDYVTTNSIKKDEKLSIIQKISVITWQYCLKYIHLFTNIAIITILTAYLFIKFTLLATIALLFMGILAHIEYKYLKSRSNYQNENYSKVLNNLNETLLKIIDCTKEIKINNKEEFFINQMSKNCQTYANLNKDKCYNNVFHIYFTEISIMATFIVILLVLFFTTNFNNQYLITSISTICVIILRLTPAINRAQSALYSINSSEKIVLELIEFDNLFKNEDKTKSTNEIMKFEKNIKLNNVSYEYPNSKTGLKNINLEIKKGDFIGIVGKSGSYKTTLCLIIAGIIKPKKGEILIDETILNNKNIKKWQNNISLLSQDFELLDEIMSNLKDETISKLNLNKSSNTNNFSQGEKQRLALANIFAKNRDVIILDEATSSIDVINEEKINNILQEIKGKKTIISIAHRFHILKHCTKIIYMDKGEIIDFDTFQNLNEKYQAFSQMVKLSNFEI